MRVARKHIASIPTFSEIIFIILTYFLLSNTIIPNLMKHFIEFNSPIQKVFYINAVSDIICISIFFIILKNHIRSLLKEFILFTEVYKYALIGFLGTIFLRMALGLIIFYIVGPDSIQSSLNQKTLVMVISEYPIFMFFCTVIFAPIVEEIVFRFAMFKPLSQINKPMAYIVSSFIFGFLHISISFIFLHNFNEIYNLPSYMVSGLMLAYVYDKTNKLASSILAHMLTNYMGFLFIVFASYL